MPTPQIAIENDTDMILGNVVNLLRSRITQAISSGMHGKITLVLSFQDGRLQLMEHNRSELQKVVNPHSRA